MFTGLFSPAGKEHFCLCFWLHCSTLVSHLTSLLLTNSCIQTHFLFTPACVCILFFGVDYNVLQRILFPCRQALKLSPAAVPSARSYLRLRLLRSRAFTPEPLCVSVRLKTSYTFKTFYFQCWRHKEPVKKTFYFLVLIFPVKPAETRPQGGRVVQLAASRRCFSNIWTDLRQDGSNTLSIIS